MSWVVVEVATESSSPVRVPVMTWGPYETKDEAEQARRRIHLDNWRFALGSWVKLPRTYVSQVVGYDRD